MPLSQVFLPEFDHEMSLTRKTLERVPETKFEWRPHPKSMTMQALTTHLSNLPSWTKVSLEQDSFDVQPAGAKQFTVDPVASTAAALEIFDRNVAEGRASIAAATDQQFMQEWSLLKGGETMFSMPKAAVLRSFVLSHCIHHRAQLGLYLRLTGCPVPSIYGPTADEEL